MPPPGPIARRFPLLSPGLLIRRKAIRLGFLGDSRLWQFVGLVVFGRQILRRVFGAEPETVARERLEPGQSILLIGLRNER